ncbi:glycosyltransferase family 4 protein [Vibrio viridaestus]|uniref:Glycosyltransferase n=1 Tax=Vibrio viridaestus TaxID=2487322 RepID=A0A3N9TJ56_9VIBR|nr:glycosyltransferase family 4 protein [Vibrio viridaestus]RQW63883.1 glycosyltransferase [Vibrio viridaestus]
MRILHVAETVVGGIATYLNFLEKIHDDEQSIHNVYLLPDSQAKYISGEIVTFKRDSRGLSAILQMMLAFIKTYKKVKPDVIFLHSSFAGLVRLIAIFNPEIKSKIIYCSHGWSFDMEDKKPLYLKIYAKIERFLAYYCRTIICISKYEMERAKQVNIRNDKLCVVYNCVDDNVSLLDNVDKDKFKLDKNRIYCLFVGRDSNQKGFDLLPAISEFLPQNMTILVVGNLKEYESNEKIQHFGWCTKSDVDYLRSKSKFLLIPSRWEGFGYVVVEAFRQNLPVIGSNRGALPELIREGKDGFIFDLSDISSIKPKIDLILDDKIHQEVKVTMADRYKDFSFDKFNLNILDIYNKVAK